jgi:hypothetical protein
MIDIEVFHAEQFFILKKSPGYMKVNPWLMKREEERPSIKVRQLLQELFK